MTNLESKPAWLENNRINEVLFCQEFLEEHPMKATSVDLYAAYCRRRSQEGGNHAPNVQEAETGAFPVSQSCRSSQMQ